MSLHSFAECGGKIMEKIWYKRRKREKCGFVTLLSKKVLTLS
jgi:hypothetical protein